MKARDLLIVVVLAAPAMALGCEPCPSSSAPGEAVVADARPAVAPSGPLTLIAGEATAPICGATEATVGIARIDAVVGGRAITIHEGEPIALDLLARRGARLLAAASLPAGELSELRVFFDDATLRLSNGNAYDTARGNLRLATRALGGQPVSIDPPVLVGPGIDARVLVDLDLGRTFRPIPACDPQDAAIYVLAPVIRTTDPLGVVPRRDVLTRLGRPVGDQNRVIAGATTVADSRRR